jgi:ubiquinone biosynthesis protein UbiJ
MLIGAGKVTEHDLIDELQAQLEAATREIDRLRTEVAALERRLALGSLLSR